MILHSSIDNNDCFKIIMSILSHYIHVDTIYTERYMGLPYKEDNHHGYENARLSTRYNDFRNKTYLLVHGSLDDNVHYQQSMALARSLEVNDIPFEQIVSKRHALIALLKLYLTNHNSIFFPDLSRRGSFIMGSTKASLSRIG